VLVGAPIRTSSTSR